MRITDFFLFFPHSLTCTVFFIQMIRQEEMRNGKKGDADKRHSRPGRKIMENSFRKESFPCNPHGKNVH